MNIPKRANSLGGAVQFARKEVLGTTQERLAGGLNITQSHLSQIENNERNPSAKLLRELADMMENSTAGRVLLGLAIANIHPRSLEVSEDSARIAFRGNQP